MASVQLATQRKETEEPIGVEQTPLVSDLKGNLDGRPDNEFTLPKKKRRKKKEQLKSCQMAEAQAEWVRS